MKISICREMLGFRFPVAMRSMEKLWDLSTQKKHELDSWQGIYVCMYVCMYLTLLLQESGFSKNTTPCPSSPLLSSPQNRHASQNRHESGFYEYRCHVKEARARLLLERGHGSSCIRQGRKTLGGRANVSENSNLAPGSQKRSSESKRSIDSKGL